jgi:hypothetical protein
MFRRLSMLEAVHYVSIQTNLQLLVRSASTFQLPNDYHWSLCHRFPQHSSRLALLMLIFLVLDRLHVFASKFGMIVFYPFDPKEKPGLHSRRIPLCRPTSFTNLPFGHGEILNISHRKRLPKRPPPRPSRTHQKQPPDLPQIPREITLFRSRAPLPERRILRHHESRLSQPAQVLDFSVPARRQHEFQSKAFLPDSVGAAGSER